MIILANIQPFMSTFVNLMANGIQTTFTTLENMQFGGTNALQVLITINILGVFIPVLLTLVNNQGIGKIKSDIKDKERAKRSRE